MAIILEIGCPEELEIMNEIYFVVGRNKTKDQTVMTFHVINTESSTPHMTTPRTMNEARESSQDKFVQGHMVTSSDLLYDKKAYDAGMKAINKVMMHETLNIRVLNKLEHLLKKLGKLWEKVAVFTFAKYE